MSAAPPTMNRPAALGEPVWEIAEVLPVQGDWHAREYLRLNTNRLVEFDRGRIEILPMPTKTHQAIVAFFYDTLRALVGYRGRLLQAGYPIRVGPETFRKPDVIYMTPEQDARAGEQYTEAAALVMEVVSPDNPPRDHETKRREYAAAGTPEYWIVDPAEHEVLVLSLPGEVGAEHYVEHGRFGAGERATSATMEGLGIRVDELFAAAR